jgi:hypothetical protein
MDALEWFEKWITGSQSWMEPYEVEKCQAVCREIRAARDVARLSPTDGSEWQEFRKYLAEKMREAREAK